MNFTGKVRTHPRISLNKLGEYLVAKAARRSRIIRDSKYPSPFVTSWYTEAITAISGWICTGASEDALLTEAIGHLVARQPDTEHGRSKKSLCIEAIKRFHSLSKDLDLPVGRVSYQAPGNTSAKMSLNGVSVSVRPEIVMSVGHGSNRNLGAIKLCLSKSHPLTDESGEYVATVLHAYLCNAQRDSTIDDSRVNVVDVFSGTVHGVPRARKNRMKDVLAACEEIRQRWHSITQ